MGTCIPVQKYSLEMVVSVNKPTFFCCTIPGIEDKAISINIELSKKLLDCVPKKRTMKIEPIFNQILDERPDYTIIKDFDVLFNPNYKIDVLRIMTASGKKKPFGVIWPGNYDNEKLIYADNSYVDYKVYDINQYDILCVI